MNGGAHITATGTAPGVGGFGGGAIQLVAQHLVRVDTGTVDARGAGGTGGTSAAGLCVGNTLSTAGGGGGGAGGAILVEACAVKIGTGAQLCATGGGGGGGGAGTNAGNGSDGTCDAAASGGAGGGAATGGGTGGFALQSAGRGSALGLSGTNFSGGGGGGGVGQIRIHAVSSELTGAKINPPPSN